jgi:hypothetical protein
MARFGLRVATAAILLGAGWTVGQAQTPNTPTPDFEINIIAPAGSTAVACVRGCEFGLSRERDGVATHGRMSSFKQSCGAPGSICEISVRGWLIK